jgi:elongation factor 2
MNKIKDYVIKAFQWATKEGALADEPMRSTRFDIIHATLPADAAKRGPGQIIPTARRAILAAYLLAEPTILEPVYLVEMQGSHDAVGTISQHIVHRHGTLIDDEQIGSSQVRKIRAYLSASSSFGLITDLPASVSDQAAIQVAFHHWDHLGSAVDPASTCGSVLRSLRERKQIVARTVDQVS